MPSPLDTALRMLADPTRRRLLFALLEHNPQRDTALHPIDDVPLAEGETERLTLEMHHNHLPKLEDAGLIRWDRQTHEVAKGPNFDEVRPILSLLKNDPDILAKPA